jgi:hypothetical protein
MTDYRAELQRLVKAYDEHHGIGRHHDRALFRAVKAARAALAQPEPEGVTDKEIEQEAIANADTDDEYRAFKRGAFFVQERISRPTTEPVPVSERPWEREGWCDAEGRCWFLFEGSSLLKPCWVLGEPGEGILTHSFSLPHHALPIPTP